MKKRKLQQLFQWKNRRYSLVKEKLQQVEILSEINQKNHFQNKSSIETYETNQHLPQKSAMKLRSLERSIQQLSFEKSQLKNLKYKLRINLPKNPQRKRNGQIRRKSLKRLRIKKEKLQKGVRGSKLQSN